MVDKVSISKAVATIFSLVISYLIVVQSNLYPLRLTYDLGFTAQIPLRYWVATSSSIGLLILLNYLFNSNYLSLIFTILFYVLFSLSSFLVYGTSGGGFVPDRVAASRYSPHINERYYIDGQFPIQDILQRVQFIMIEHTDDLLIGVEIAFTYHVILLAVSVWLFIYANHRNGAYAFLGACVFLITTYTLALRFRYVPQLLALILLIFLFSVHNKRGKRWIGIKVVLFLSLILSHPMMFIYYLFPVLIYPAVSGVWNSFGEVHSDKSEGTLLLFTQTLIYSPFELFRTSINNVYRNFIQPAWAKYMLLLGVIYASFYIYVFVGWQRRVFTSILLSDGVGDLPRFIDTIRSFDSGGQASATSTQQLHHLTSPIVTSVTTFSTILLLILIGLMLASTSLIRQYDTYSPFHIAIFITAIIHIVFSIYTPVFGNRALQILFLPFLYSVYKIENKNILRILLIFLLISSPVLGINYMNNQELLGGDRTPDYYTEKSGKFIGQYSSGDLIRPHGRPGSVYPLSNEEPAITVRDVLNINGTQEYSPEAGDILQFSPRMKHKTEYYRNICNYDEQNKIYDNTNKLLAINKNEFECSPTS